MSEYEFHYDKATITPKYIPIKRGLAAVCSTAEIDNNTDFDDTFNVKTGKDIPESVLIQLGEEGYIVRKL